MFNEWLTKNFEEIKKCCSVTANWNILRVEVLLITSSLDTALCLLESPIKMKQCNRIQYENEFADPNVRQAGRVSTTSFVTSCKS